jgi:hypothetical protein
LVCGEWRAHLSERAYHITNFSPSSDGSTPCISFCRTSAACRLHDSGRSSGNVPA